MKNKTTLFVIALTMMMAMPMTSKQINVGAATFSPKATLMISSEPATLTAGVVSELVDPSTPFTIIVKDANGNPVDLTLGGTIKNVDVWNNLFKDPFPEILPQYFWVRTDANGGDGFFRVGGPFSKSLAKQGN
ncbi:MAG: hypothetical protein HGA95_05100 [Caldiserica bacterium]|nr:hypothetical protein [Caldisericota bacterium]